MAIETGNQPSATSEGPIGATITTAYVARSVRAFAVLESEVHTLSFFNTLAATLFSVASAFLSFAVGIWSNAAFTDKATPAGAILAKVGAPVLCVLAVVALCLALWALRARGSTLTTIRNESRSE